MTLGHKVCKNCTVGRALSKEERRKAQQEIIATLKEGVTLSKALHKVGIHQSTHSNWLRKYPGYADRVSRARDEGHDARADWLVDLGEDADPNDPTWARIRSDNVKWVLSRQSARYSDRLDIQVHGTPPDISSILSRSVAVLPGKQADAESPPLAIEGEYTTVDHGSTEGDDDDEPMADGSAVDWGDDDPLW